MSNSNLLPDLHTGFSRGRWSDIPISFRIFQFIVIHRVKGFGIASKAEIDVFFWNSVAFSMVQCMLAIWSLVPLPFLKSSSVELSTCQRGFRHHIKEMKNCVTTRWITEESATNWTILRNAYYVLFFFNLNDVLSIFLHRCSDSSFIFSFKSSRHFAKSHLAAFLSRQSINCVGTQSLHSEKSTASFDKKENIGKHSKKPS